MWGSGLGLLVMCMISLLFGSVMVDVVVVFCRMFICGLFMCCFI